MSRLLLLCLAPLAVLACASSEPQVDLPAAPRPGQEADEPTVTVLGEGPLEDDGAEPDEEPSGVRRPGGAVRRVDLPDEEFVPKREGFIGLPDGGQLFHTDAGSGRALLFLGGGGMDLHQWDGPAADLSRDHRVIRCDYRGWGRSPPPTGPYDQARDVAAVMDVLGLQSAVVVGFSAGGGVAIELALTRPDLVDVLVLVASTVSGFEWSDDFVERNVRMARTYREQGGPALVEAALADPWFAPGAADDPELRARVSRLMLDNIGVFDLDPSLLRGVLPPAITQLDAIQAPTLVVLPERDHPEVHEVGRLLAERLPKATLVQMPAAGHLLHVEQPERFTRLLRGFLDTAGAPLPGDVSR